jgi:hypothetical protein
LTRTIQSLHHFIHHLCLGFNFKTLKKSPGLFEKYSLTN